MIVLDSSAMVAYFNAEPGGDLVRDLLHDDERDIAIYAHAINLCEVFYGYLQATPLAVAHSARESLKEAGVIERNDMDTAFWQDVAMISAGYKLALGDACGVALARREGADFYTTDRGELARRLAGYAT